MRSARILFATTAAAGTLALAVPGGYAFAAGDWDKDGSSQSQEHDRKDHDKPKGGIHTGSGALSLTNADDWSKDHEKKDHDKPKGGMHTGGGGLDGAGTNVTGAVVLAGGLAAFVLHRRRKAADSAS